MACWIYEGALLNLYLRKKRENIDALKSQKVLNYCKTRQYGDSRWKCVENSKFWKFVDMVTSKAVLNEGRKASHNNFSSEPHSPHFLVRAASESSSFDYFV